jgi:hypothetical protein
MTVALNTGAGVDTSTTAAPEGHEAAMIAKVDGQTTPATTPATTPDRPAWLPEKFASVEDMAKAYTELEKKQGGQQQQEAPKPADKQSLEVPTQQQAQQAVADAGLDFDALNTEYAKDGKLSDATYEALKAKGISKAVADSYIAGQEALANQTRTEVFSVAGGEEAYTEMVTWARDNLSAADIDAYNNAMNAGNVSSMKLAVEGLRSRFVAANGSAPKLLGGNSGQGPAASGDVFRSTAELTSAMKDPRYTSDPAYREDVRAKLGRSNIM